MKATAVKRIRKLAVSPSGKYLAFGHIGGSITLWKIAATTTDKGQDSRKCISCKYVATIRKGNGVEAVGQLEFLPNSTTLVYSHLGTWALHFKDIHRTKCRLPKSGTNKEEICTKEAET